MLSVLEAQHIIDENTPLLSSEIRNIDKALGKVLSADIVSPIDLPPFLQSSMDGYAFSFNSLKQHSSLLITHTIPAGDSVSYEIGEGEAVRIFTGSPIPHGCDTVVMQEKTEIKNDRLYIQDSNISEGANTRSRGSEIKSGTIALTHGTRISPAAIGFLASMGIQKVEVYRSPSICILVTGDELTFIDQNLSYGKVYDSNSYTLSAACRQSGIENVVIKQVKDQLEIVKQILDQEIRNHDLVLLTGGVSVGDYDYVVKAAEAIGVHTHFHKIKQKPGKPMYFGRYESKAELNNAEHIHQCLVFGLPGNPASALTCFYEYVEPSLKKMMGDKSAIQIIHAPITSSYKKNSGLTHFLKANYDGRQVTPLDAQESFRLKSFALSNALIRIEEDISEVSIGQMVEVHVLP